MKIRITKEYSNKTIFNEFELEFQENEIVCILGESGVGKTTLLEALARSIKFDGELEAVPDEVSCVFQTPRLLPHLTVEQNLFYVFKGRKEERNIEKIIEKCSLAQVKNRKARTLSGGEKQRVSIARAFLSDAKLLLMDEPFVALDTGLKIRLLRLFAELWREKPKTVVFVTHDADEALAIADRIVLLKRGGVKKEFFIERRNFPSEYGENSEVKREILTELINEK